MIPTPATGPDGGHSLYCLSDSDGDGFDQTLYADFAAAIEAAIETSVVTEDLCDPTYVMAVPAGSEISLHQLEQGHVAAIVFRKVVFSPATGQALEPAVKPTPWGELQDRIAAQNKMITGLQTSLSQTLELMISALEQVHLIDAPGVPGEIGWNVYPQIQALEELTTTVKQIDIPF
jgi:hypothetical protein